jgi:D-glycero-D-manno-heptose 1,7-bisphosphate phosphatase
VIPGRIESRPNSNKVVVLDRDGTIVVDRDYLSDPEALQFAPEAESGLRRMRDMGFRLVVITNQSGIARGFFSISRLDDIHTRLRQMLGAIGVPVAGIYYCPHGPGDDCECRKPSLGLMRQASEELGFDISKTIVIGDKESDVEFGRRAGGVTILIANSGVPVSTAADHVAKNLREAAEIISQMSQESPDLS